MIPNQMFVAQSALWVWNHIRSKTLQTKIVTFFFSLNRFFSNHPQSLWEGLVFLEAPSRILAFVFLETFSL